MNRTEANQEMYPEEEYIEYGLILKDDQYNLDPVRIIARKLVEWNRIPHDYHGDGQGVQQIYHTRRGTFVFYSCEEYPEAKDGMRVRFLTASTLPELHQKVYRKERDLVEQAAGVLGITITENPMSPRLLDI